METLEILENEKGDLYIQIPDNLLEEMNWKEGDDLSWTDNKNGTWTIAKKEEINEK